MASEREIEAAFSTLNDSLRSHFESNPNDRVSFLRSPLTFAASLLKAAPKAKPSAPAPKAKPSVAAPKAKHPAPAPKVPVATVKQGKARPPATSRSPPRARSPPRTRSPPHSCSPSRERRGRSRSLAPRSRSRSCSRQRSRSRLRMAVIIDSPASPDPTAPVRMDDSPIENDGFTVVQSKGKKRSADSASPPPPPKAPCPAPGSAATSLDDSSAPPARSEKPPRPLVLREKHRWQEVTRLLTEHNVAFIGKTCADGISVRVPTAADYRKATKSLRDKTVQFHAYPLEDEKVLRVVIRGLPKELEVSDIRDDLLTQGFPVLEVHRMTGGRSKAPLDLVLAILERSQEGKRIFQLREVLNLSGLKVEAPKRKGVPGQCHRCQLYGHAARFCEAAYRCVKCAGDHSTSMCNRTRDDPSPPSCVLCGTQGHTANYRGCPKAPKAAAGPRRPPPLRQLPRSQASGPKPRSTPPQAAPTYVDAPPPVTSAWSKPPSMARASTLPSKAPVPTRAPTQDYPVPPPKQSKAPKATPAPRATHSLKDDLTLLSIIASSINMDEVREVARKLRNDMCPSSLIEIMEQHASLFSAIARLSPSLS